ncbi:MAG: PEP-CTERM sorting domain-containing protein [Burkholderiales bacterium]|jgi:hypothetical protein|nr:PEP-CTERM sorting domain-containing protein [Burkholderiales bacterium]
MRLFKWISAVLGTFLLAPANAFAFPVDVSFTRCIYDAAPTPQCIDVVPTLPYVNEVLNITFSVTGGASGISGLYVDLIPDTLFPSFDESNLAYMKKANDSGAATDTGYDYLPGVSVQWRLYPKAVGAIFNVADGGIVDIVFTEILAKADPARPFTSVMGFQICTVNPNGDSTCEPGSVPVSFVVPNGANRVPEPTSLWLVLAALVAGAAVFRKGSNRS